MKNENYINPADFLEAANKATRLDPDVPSIDRAYNPNQHTIQTAEHCKSSLSFDLSRFHAKIYVTEDGIEYVMLGSLDS